MHTFQKKLNKSQKNYTVTELECLAAIVCLKRFRPYVEGLPFKIITDHHSLRWLMSQKDLSGRLGRWSLLLQRFDFEIEYRKGSANIVPDALSRLDVDEISLTDESIPLEVDLESEYFKSDEYLNLIAVIKAEPKNFPDTIVSEGYIYQRVKFRQGVFEDEDSLWKLWVPFELRADVVASCHGGLAKTLQRIKEKYFWPNMAKEVKQYVSNCEICKSVKPTNQI